MSDRFYDAGAAGYDQIFGFASREFVPTLLRLACIAPGHRVLDVATGTGHAAKAAIHTIGPHGEVVAVDISAPMLEEARKRLGSFPNITFAVENGQALTLPDESFDVVLCSLGLMFFPDHAQGVAEFFRVLKRGGRAAVSVITSPRRSIHGRIQAVIAQHFASRATAVAHSYALGEERTLRRLFEGAGFQDIETCGETRGFPFPSFDAFFDPIEQGTGYIGQEWITLSHDVQHLVREDVCRELEGTDGRGGSIEIQLEVTFASGRK